MKSILLVIGAAIVFLLGSQITQPTLAQSSLGVMPPSGRSLTVYQIQGSNRSTLQRTDTDLQPANSEPQGNQEDADNLQPALGYGALNWKM